MKSFPKLLLASSIALQFAPAFSAVAQGNIQKSFAAVQNYRIPAGSLKTSLAYFSETSSVQIFVSDRLVNGLNSREIQGQLSPKQALNQLLAGTQLKAVWKNEQAVVIKKVLSKPVIDVETSRVDVELAPIEVIQVNGSRTQQGLSSLSRQTTILDGEALSRELGASANLAQVIGKLVPGMAPAGQTMTNFGLTMRGRNMLVLIDGVPMNTNRNVSRDLFNIHPAQIASIEIVRGGNAIYGSGATGGVMYITTRKATDNNQTRLGLGSSLTQVQADGLSYHIGQSLGLSTDKLAFSFDADSQITGGYYDASGHRLAPEPSQGDLFDSKQLSIQAKGSYQPTDSQMLELGLVSFRSWQNTDYASDPSVAALERYSSPAKAIRGIQLEQQNEAKNLMLNLAWQDQEFFGHRLSSQLYSRQYETFFYPFDGRPYGGWGHIAQSFLDSKVYGLRTSLTKYYDAHRFNYGVDANFERTAMPVLVYDSEAYDASGGLNFVNLGQRTFMPETDTNSQAVFAQYTYRSEFGLTLDAGVRHEKVDVKFGDFVTLGQKHQVQGGDLSYSDTLVNVTLDYELGEGVGTYVAFNQGFELPDIGLQLRYANAQFDIGSSSLKPVTADNLEWGVRYSLANSHIDLSLFQSTSDQGRVKNENFGWALRRDEEKIRGIELEASHAISEQWEMNLMLSKIAGEEKPESADDWRDMNGFRIPPFKAALTLSYQGNEWLVQTRVNHVGSEDYRLGGKDSFGRHRTTSYTTVDLTAQVEKNWGSLSFGLENLTNRDHFPLYSQLLRNNKNTSYIPAKGTSLTLSYRYDW